eukprot:TRINITY_DN9556_c1_g1_i1.p1 TRINITY_DN9556_c1_g1~~TRINITY_DN9556_c1_g1_i1.p1  ORF type:complete len:140 (+),score=76.66 TRINITY_DN9556_c1_g1_i1:66-485(+)
MAMSGVQLAGDCVTEFEALKTKSAYQGIAYRVGDDGKEIIIDHKYDKGTSFADFCGTVPADQARYYVWDYSFEDEGVKKSKLFFISWIPDSCNVKKRMLAASSKDALKKKIEGGLIEVQATDKGDLDEKELLGRAKKGF